jgi:hypothetical protein
MIDHGLDYLSSLGPRLKPEALVTKKVTRLVSQGGLFSDEKRADQGFDLEACVPTHSFCWALLQEP